MNVRLLYSFLILACLLPPALTHAAIIEGVVKDENNAPIPGAQITLTSADDLYAESVYTNASGDYTLETQQTGALQLRVRKPYHGDEKQKIDIPGKGVIQLTTELHRLTSPQEISDSLSASAHFSRIEFDTPRELGFFKVECLTCHQLGNKFTRTPRTKEQWETIVTRMLGFWGVQDNQWVERYAKVLSAAFDGSLQTTRQNHIVDPEIYTARITQWKLPGAIIAHDVTYHEADGKFYTVEQWKDRIYITDPKTNTTETYDLPTAGFPVGGKFMRLLNNPTPYGLVGVRHGPHSLVVGPDQKIYITDTVSGQIGVFDPKTKTHQGYDIGGKALYPHTLRFNSKGNLWFTIADSNQIGRFNPKTKKMTLLDLPATRERLEMPRMMPYGIDVNPVDGSIWYGRLMANRIGRVDPVTLEIQEFSPPLIGPRRMRFSKDGTLWIPAYGDGTLVKLNTQTMEYTHYKLPMLSPGEAETPYAVGVHPVTQEVWITANMSDRLFRFLPDEERFISYLLPTRGIFLRDIIFTPDGRVCASSSAVPPTVVLEGGMEEVICLDPQGNSAN